ncbi:MAG: 16S rRNA (cytidine(1402)-2'-O)-methyltransferase [Varibaculum sp.]|nr:16S rRNA (cytidine(1402)-2'-O)-methyltransferase [Varibaculum sp.]
MEKGLFNWVMLSEELLQCYRLPVGVISLAATPIGNLGDASLRLCVALATADLIAAEDTRTTRELAAKLGVRISGEMLAYHNHNEVDAAKEIIAAAAAGSAVLVVSDAGMPGVSDPGFRVVQAACAAGVEVRVIPGPSAPIAALAISGLPSDRFLFAGFLPRSGVARSRVLQGLVGETATLLFLESPNRLAGTLADLAEAFGAERRAAVAREITKKFEEVRRGTLTELGEWAANGVRGEIVLVVSGADSSIDVDTAQHASYASPALNTEELSMKVQELTELGVRRKDAARWLAHTWGEGNLSANSLYKASLGTRQ